MYKRERQNDEAKPVKVSKVFYSAIYPEIWCQIWDFSRKYSDFLKLYMLHRENYQYTGWKHHMRSKELSMKRCITSLQNLDFSYVSHLDMTNCNIGLFYAYNGFSPISYIERINFHDANNLQNDHLTGFTCTGLNLCGCCNIDDLGVSYLTNCIDLELGGTKVTDKGLEMLGNVKELGLYGCHEVSDDGIKHLKSVKTFRLGDNKKITDECFQYLEQVESLAMQGSVMITGSGFHHLKRIQGLDVMDCPNIDAKFLDSLKNLHRFHIGNPVFGSLDFLKEWKQLHTLSICLSNSVGSDDFQYLSQIKKLHLILQGPIECDGFKYMGNLETLEMSGATDEVTLNTNLRFLKNLKKLIIPGVKMFPPESIKEIGLKKLDLSQKFVNYRQINQDGRKIPISLFPMLKGIKTLDLSGLYINTTKGNPIDVTNSMKNLAGIQNLKIPCNAIITDEALQSLKGIKSLTLNTVSNKGIGQSLKHIFTDKGLENLQGIQVLSIMNSRITGSGLKWLAGITWLDCSFCPFIEDSDLKHLAGIVGLNIRRCIKITDCGLSYLVGINTLNIRNCRITDQGISYLKGIHSLDMRDCVNLTYKCLSFLKGIHALKVSSKSLIGDSTFIKEFLSIIPNLKVSQSEYIGWVNDPESGE